MARNSRKQPSNVKRASAATSRIRRVTAAETPTYIRAAGTQLSAAAKTEMRRKLARKLGRHALDVERTSVRIEDVNGPRGGVDKSCRIKIVLRALASVVVEEQHASLQAAFDGALDRAQLAVRQALKRRRVEPRRSKKKTTTKLGS